jgi:hypothetical protein
MVTKTVTLETAKEPRRITTPLYAVPAETMRPISSVTELQPGEVAVAVKGWRPGLVQGLMPRPKPSELAFEVWRLVRHRGLSYGQVASTSRVAPFLSPKSRSADPRRVKIQLAKKYVQQVDAFLDTPIGHLIKTSALREDPLADRSLLVLLSSYDSHQRECSHAIHHSAPHN